MAELARGKLLKKVSAADAQRQQAAPIPGAGIKSGKLSFRSELANRMVRKNKSILRRETTEDGVDGVDGGDLATLGEDDEDEEEYEDEDEGTGTVYALPPAALQRSNAPAPVALPAPTLEPQMPRDPGQPPTWKRNIVARKAIAAQADTVDAAADDEDDFKGEPAWKQNLLRAKAKKERENNAPALKRQQEEDARLQKLAAMPPWMRALAEKT